MATWDIIGIVEGVLNMEIMTGKVNMEWTDEHRE